MIKNIFILLGEMFQNMLKIRTKPHNLQLPVTARCNSRCMTCNVWKDPENRMDIDPAALKTALQDKTFSKVRTVGINGGEPTLYKDMDGLLDAIFSLKNLRKIHIISNSLLPDRLLAMLARCKEKCAERGVHLGVTISLDGVGEVHDKVRGIPGNFQKTISVLNQVKADSKRYCDDLHIGCTVSRYNAPYLAQIESYFSTLGIPVIDHLAVPNKRIGTYDCAEYSVLNDDQSRLLAAEFFLAKTLSTRKPSQMMFNFGNYHYLINGGKGRIAMCSYRYRDVTIDENLNFYLCATASDCVGSLKEKSVSELRSNGAVKAMQRQIAPLCDTCIHYQSALTFRGAAVFMKFMLSRYFRWRVKFKILAKWSR